MPDLPSSRTGPRRGHLSEEEAVAYARRTLPQREVTAIEDHLVGCEDCRELAAGLLRTMPDVVRRNTVADPAAARRNAAAPPARSTRPPPPPRPIPADPPPSSEPPLLPEEDPATEIRPSFMPAVPAETQPYRPPRAPRTNPPPPPTAAASPLPPLEPDRPEADGATDIRPSFVRSAAKSPGTSQPLSRAQVEEAVETTVRRPAKDAAPIMRTVSRGSPVVAAPPSPPPEPPTVPGRSLSRDALPAAAPQGRTPPPQPPPRPPAREQAEAPPPKRGSGSREAAPRESPEQEAAEALPPKRGSGPREAAARESAERAPSAPPRRVLPADNVSKATPYRADEAAPVQEIAPEDPSAGPPGSLPPGTQLGRYVVRDRLGAGGMGVVYASYDPELDRKVAIKLMHPGSSNAELRARLLREAQAMAKVHHPNVVAVYDVGTFQEQVFVAMEFVEGVTLSRWLRQKRSMRQVLEVFRQAGKGLAAAHSSGVVHRDFKPENVLVGVDGSTRVMDFGLARAAGQDATSPGTAAPSDPSTSGPLLGINLTATGAVMGTPAYMAPEQFRNGPTDARTDQFSFCVALYRALYGEKPFAGDELHVLMHEVLKGNIRPPPADTKVPPWIRDVLLKGLSQKPDDRFPSMEALLNALAHGPSDEAPERERTVRVIWRGAALGAVAIAAVLGLSATHTWKSFEERAQGLIVAARPKPWNPEVVLLNIDQATLHKMGWPIQRPVIGKVIEALGAAGVKAVGVDIFYNLPSAYGPAVDAALGKSLAKLEGRAVLASPCSGDESEDLEKLSARLQAHGLPVGATPAIICPRLLAPVDSLVAAAPISQVEIARSASGNVRGVYLLAESGGARLPTLALATFAVGNGARFADILQEPGGVRVGELLVPTNAEGATLASFRLPTEDVVVSFADLYDLLSKEGEPRLPADVAETLAGRYVLIGQTAESIRDLGPLATGEQMPLVLLHGALLGDLLEHRIVQEVPRWLQMLLIIACGGLLTAAALFLRPWLAGVSVLVLIQGVLGGALLLAKWSILVNPVAPTVAGMLAFTFVLAGRLTAQERERQLLRSAFHAYVDETILQRILEDPDSYLSLEGARKELTILSAEMEGTTDLSSELTPEEAVGLMREYLAAITQLVLKREGRVDTLRGNSVLAVFGDPIPSSDHPKRAVEAALAMQAEVARLLEQHRASGLTLRIGVATGDVLVGNLGVQKGKLEYTVLGPAVDLAVRLAASAPGGGVLASGRTREASPNGFAFDEVEVLDVNGEPIEAYEVSSNRDRS